MRLDCVLGVTGASDFVKENIWDKYWRESQEIDVEKIIRGDSYYRILKRLIELPSERQELKILEVGCGSGIRTLALQRDFQEQKFQVSLVDLSFNALLFARKNFKQNKIGVNLILADGFKLPFPDENFDIVWNEGVNEHFDGEARYEIFREMSRVCKSEGQIIVIVPNAFNLPYRITKKILEMKNRWAYGFEKPYTLFELKDKMKRAKLTPIKAEGAGVISSFFAFSQLIPKRTNRRDERKEEDDGYLVSMQIFTVVENVFEAFLGALCGKDIGVRGTKLRKS